MAIVPAGSTSVELNNIYATAYSTLLASLQETVATIQPLSRISAAANSNGEVVLKWDMKDPQNDIETCIIIATYAGITAPLGAVASYPGIKTHEFVDRVLNAYVGSKTYTILFVTFDGSIIPGSKHATIVKKANMPLGVLK